MTSLLFSGKEYNVTLNFIDEAFRLYGIDAKVYDVHTINMYHDDRSVDSGVPYKILMSDYVDTRLLSNLKWSTLDADREAITVLAPIQYNGKKFNLRDYSVIRFFNGDLYQIREVNSQYLLNVSYVLKLISYRDEPNRDREDKQMKTNFLRTTREEIE